MWIYERTIVLVLPIFVFLRPSWAKIVRVTELRVPSTAIFGESVTLMCSYELGSEELYVVKWYKDDLEFYRFEPKDDNQSIYFPQPGIDIDLSKSGSNIVYLRNVALDSAGTYKCQVSTDAPTYSCVQAVKEMNVVIMPLEGPTISGGEGNYDFGDNVTLNCTSAKSKPAAELSWLVNGKTIDENETMSHGVIIYSDNLEATSKSLQLPVTENLLNKGKVAIKCEATFYGRVAMSSKDITIIEYNSASNSISRSLFLIFILFIALWPGIR
ncbi:endothelial cell-selective adhesion molecule-like isoform X2 [Uloborus diversus]|uniref:endothelial cell-selective adhesion molecule-like isoform X1 n=1 Tax=Uloborus diversus TaxID=327109 RepID=UPI00240A6D44|nr:endothelial cell-selective adhesion molecule-like isoform X1 [Uloborus diversus]XP_054716666.1 endothelial cell-selective adhesion molecule-like isoform X1 [Uloborus diversus]XP_054716667.1 endothelial cell-selective adhesion molecule-like isoform X2 [Uloborus diversus]